MPLKSLRSARPPLSSWLFVSVTTALVAAVVLCALLINRFARVEAREQATRYLQINADALRDALDRGMAQHVAEVQVLSRLAGLSRERDPAAVRRALDAVHDHVPQFAWLGLADAQGRVVAASGGLLEGVDVSKRPWFQGARLARYVGDVHAAVLLEKLLPAQAEPWRFVDIAVPIPAEDGSLRGVLGVHLSWTWAAEIKRELVDPQLAQHQAEAMVLAADGTVLLGPDRLEGRRLDVPPGHLIAASPTRGAGAYPGLGWEVVLHQPQEVALASFEDLQRNIVWGAAALCLLLATLGWLLARRLSAPLLELTAALEAHRPLVASRDPLYREADVLGQALRAYAERQADDAARLRELNATLQQRVDERTAALADSEQRLRDIADNMPAVIAYFDAEERCRFANARALKMYPVSREHVPRVTLSEALGARGYADHRACIARALAGERGSVEGQMDVDGRRVDFQTHFVPDVDPAGQVRGLYMLSYDQSALKSAERRLRTIADHMPALISYVDRQERYQFCNATYREWMGLDVQAVIGQPVSVALGEALYAQRKPLLARALAGERCDFDSAFTHGGVTRHLHSIYLPDIADDGTVAGLYVLAVDVSAMKTAEEQLIRTARTDTLTGLPNRLRFNERLTEALARSRRTRQPIALLFLDVDHFKAINDTHGHAAGDEVLKEFAARLRATVRETDTVARLAGDEFVVILEGLGTDAEVVHGVAGKILQAIGHPFHVSGRELQVSTSIGIAFHAGGEADPEQLLSAADKALYRAKADRDTYALTTY